MRSTTFIDLGKNELRNARVHNLSTPPASPVTGQLYYDTDDNILYYWNGTTWTATSGGGGGTNYQTMRDGGSAMTQRAALNFVDSTGITFALTDDVGNNETEVTASPAFGSVTTETSFGQASGNGSAGTIARSDHTHGTPTHDAAAHSAIPLSALAAPTAAVSLNNQKITSLANGTAATDAVNLGQVQDLVNVGTNKTAVRAATTINGTLATAFANGQILDNVTLVTGDRILLKDQSTASENGIYIVNASGAPTRATDADISAEVKGGLAAWVNEGTVNGDTRWVLTTNDPITLGSTSLTFVQDFKATSTTAGSGLSATGGVLSVGAGTGISVGADSVGIDTSLVARWKVHTITGDNTTTSFALAHNLAQDRPLVQLWDTTASPPEVVIGPEIRRTDANTTTVVFPTAPATGQNYQAVIIG